MTGIGLLYLSGTKFLSSYPSFSTLTNQLGGLVIVSVALAALWDLGGKRAFAEEIRENINVKHEITVSGLESIGTDYSKIVDWDAALSSAIRLDIFAAWATTWRNTHQAKLVDMTSRPDARIRAILPDPNDQPSVEILATRFNMPASAVRTKLSEAIADYKRLDENNATGKVEIYTSRVFRAFTAYRVDDRFIVTLYHHKDSRSGSVPAVSCRRGGTLHEFFSDDLEGVINASTKVYP
ncbi:hypothetical protein [Streptomyces sp. AA1529]|uniref:hypothetical protein n=1 Tax=Streptomyces sp. AA1529 TaxID=1203257 RepID=UPI003D74F042